MDAETLEAARAVAFRYLGYAARSRSEIERRLERADFDPAVIAQVVSEMETGGWLDDRRFASDWVADRADRKQYGRARLAAELRRRGVEAEAVDDALSTVDVEAEVRRALAAARGRWHPETIDLGDRAAVENEKRRLASFLQRRGFAWDIIKEVFNRLTANKD